MIKKIPLEINELFDLFLMGFWPQKQRCFELTHQIVLFVRIRPHFTVHVMRGHLGINCFNRHLFALNGIIYKGKENGNVPILNGDMKFTCFLMLI